MCALAGEKEALSWQEACDGENYSLTIKSMVVEFIYFVAINHAIFSLDVLSISYNMGTSALPDMYARSPRAAGPRAYISGKALSAHVITNMSHFWHS